jgi:hypothetical protein
MLKQMERTTAKGNHRLEGRRTQEEKYYWNVTEQFSNFAAHWKQPKVITHYYSDCNPRM